MRRWIVIAVAVVAFLAVSLILARWLSTENLERDKVTALLRAQARGDVAAMLREIDGCTHRPGCVRTVEANARDLRTPGTLEIVAYDSATSHSLGDARGPTRVVWKTPSRLTTVQCVDVHRAGTVLSGASVTVTGLSAPIGREASC